MGYDTDELLARLKEKLTYKKALSENRNALRIAYGNSCSAQGELSYKIKKYESPTENQV